jgi:DNA-binding MarR family transcriptional regulator
MPTKNSDDRAQLLAALGREFRQLATATVLFHQAIADRLGMHATDHRCLEILARAGRMTAGELAELTGLTTGAITGVIDRLEEAEFVRRIKDPDDRRRVVIEPFAERIEREIAPLFKSLAPALADLCVGYSARDLGIIREFIAGVQRAAYDQIRKLREPGVDTKPAMRSRQAEPDASAGGGGR